MKSEYQQKGGNPISKNSISRIAKTLKVSEQTIRSYFATTTTDVEQTANEKHKKLNSSIKENVISVKL